MITQSLKRLSMLAAFLVAATTIQAAAADVSQITNLPGGVACVPDCGTGDVALDLAKNAKFLVLAMDADAANVAKLKEKAAAVGLLGRSLYVEQGTTDRISFADNYVDLLVLTGTAEKDLSAAARQEIMRVLTPIHGRLALKDKTIVKPELAGSDWWTHKLRGPDNNFASRDTAFQWPPILQYWAMPFFNSYQGAALTSSGYHIEMHDWTLKDPIRSNLSGRFMVRNAYNGQILWDDILPSGIEVNMPLFAASETTLFLAAGDRAAVFRRTLKSGETLAPISLGTDKQRVRWLALDRNVLFALIGNEAKIRAPFQFRAQGEVQSDQHLNQTLFATVITAVDVQTGKTLWSHTEASPIDFRLIAVSNDKVVFLSEGKRLAALDVTDGKLVWENTDSSWITSIKRPKSQVNGNTVNMSALSVGQGLIRITPTEADIQLVFAETDGKLLNSNLIMRSGSGQKSPIIGKEGKVFLGQTDIDPRTGNEGKGKIPAPVGMAWCGIATYAPGIGMIGHSTMQFKSPCGVGAWVAGGLLTFFPSVCGCGIGGQAIPGMGCFASGAKLFQQASEVPQHPLSQGPAFVKTPRLKSGIPDGDWPMYRGDVRHSGGSPATTPAKASLAWERKPLCPFKPDLRYNQYSLVFDERPVPALIADGLVISAGSDGMVSAVSLQKGDPAWTFQAGGPIMCSPAASSGRLFISGGDGVLYALDIASGQLAWKRRLAPVERRILKMGKLFSTWPVFSALCQDGRVYAVAGNFMHDGSKAFCLDAVTGEILWSRWFEPYITQYTDYPFDRYAFGGQLTLSRGKLWAAGFMSIPMVLDAATGEPRVSEPDADLALYHKRGYGQFAVRYEALGQDIINFDDKGMLMGGNTLFENHNIRNAYRGVNNYKLLFMDGSGGLLAKAQNLPVAVIHMTRVAPAYDRTGIAFVASLGKVCVATIGLNYWDKETFVSAASSLQKASPVGADGKVVSHLVKLDVDLDYDAAVWRHPDEMVSAVVLTADAVVVAGAREYSDNYRDQTRITKREALLDIQGWQLSAYERKDGAKRWSVPLPSEPLFNGLAIAADGTVIVTLRDGSMLGVK